MKSRFLILFLVLLVVAGCGPQKAHVYKYHYDPPVAIKSEESVKIFVAPLNFLNGRKEALRGSYQVVDDYLNEYLKLSRYEVLPPKYFIQSWMKSLEETGGIRNQVTGEFSKDRFDKCLSLTINDLSIRHKFSYIVFPDLAINSIKMNKNSDIAEWHGVKRTLPRTSFFKFPHKRAPGASLIVKAFSKSGDLHFLSKGGLDFVVKSTREGRIYRFEPREHPFENREYVAEGVKISLHPFIACDEYPEGG